MSSRDLNDQSDNEIADSEITDNHHPTRGVPESETRQSHAADGISDSGSQPLDAILVTRRSRKLIFGAWAVAIVTLGLLITAGVLSPNPNGLGTHQQLGLPPCSARVMFGFRCPSCGMTTSWSYFMKGRWIESAQTNLGGFLLALFAIFVAVMAVRTARNGRIPSEETQRYAVFVMIFIAAITMIDWVFRVFVYV